MKITCGEYCLDFEKRTYVMGILNVTPDSFSDAGLYFDKKSAVKRAEEMVREGADIIDIGGQSARPGSKAVPVSEELRRTIPVIEALSGRLGIPISIDTYRAKVAKEAVEAGASMVNDISGLRFDRGMASVVARADVPLVIMHIKGRPQNMQKRPRYKDLIGEIIQYLREGMGIARAAGINKIIIDPGIGFGKTFDHNLQIIKNLRRFGRLRRPILIGPSRKAFIGAILDGAPPEERLEGTAAAVAVSVLNGANIVRVHDVAKMSRVVKVADAIKRGSVPS
ncbi:MAG: dihydropteroate synthase [Thermodesulfovibrionales bacterium]|nr:dihydropteroate synthase [Thermodesulfovibrionales bacterium]